MAHLYKKVKKGNEYYYIRETQRVYGKPTTINQVYLGTSDKVQQALGKGGFSPKEFGSIFAINELDQNLELAELVNEVLPPKKRTKGPSLGELVFYAAMNRAIAPTSKRRLAAWYETTDIQRVRPLRLESLNSQNFWNHWDRISDADLEKISTAFFRKVHAQSPNGAQQLVIEAANLPSTPKPASVDPLPPLPAMEDGFPTDIPSSQVGLALISEMFSGIPVYYQDIPGGLNRGGFYSNYLDDLLDRVEHLRIAVKDVTLLFNNVDEPAEIMDRADADPDLHIIACVTSQAAPDLTEVSLKEFTPLPVQPLNPFQRPLKDDERVLYYETTHDFWGKPRRVVMVFDPRAFQQSYQELGKKVQKLRKDLQAALQRHLQEKDNGDANVVLQEHLVQACERFNLDPLLFHVNCRAENGKRTLDLQIDQRQMAAILRHYGKTLYITDHETWSAPEIFEAFANRCLLEGHDQPRTGSSFYNGNALDFRSPFKSALLPLYHWTDSKIRIHLFVCVVALTYLTLLCQRLKAAGIVTSPKDAMDELRSLRTTIKMQDEEGKLKRVLENITDKQAAILRALGYQVEDGKMTPLQG